MPSQLSQPSQPSQPVIQQFFPLARVVATRNQKTGSRGAVTREKFNELEVSPVQSVLPAMSVPAGREREPKNDQTNRKDHRGQRSPPVGPGEREPEIETELRMLRTLLQALPTQADLDSLATRLEEVHRRDLEVVRIEVHLLSEMLKKD